MAKHTIAEVQGMVHELLEAARSGRIIPVRLPDQIETIANALNQIEENPAETLPPESPEIADYKREQAEFMSTAIHELRVPMTSILGYADMMNSSTMGELNDMQKQFLQTIRTNARRMQGLLTDVSDVSKVRGSTLKIATKMDMLKNIAMRVEKDMQPLAEQTNRKLVFDIPQGLPILETDGEMLAKALNKLVENGLRYTQEGGTVTVSASSEGSDLLIKISDDGIGMNSEEIAQLGTLYFRADHDHVRQYKGSGLGIPITYGIIQLLGGNITVESTPEAGSTFVIRLPGIGS